MQLNLKKSPRKIFREKFPGFDQRPWRTEFWFTWCKNMKKKNKIKNIRKANQRKLFRKLKLRITFKSYLRKIFWFNRWDADEFQSERTEIVLTEQIFRIDLILRTAEVVASYKQNVNTLHFINWVQSLRTYPGLAAFCQPQFDVEAKRRGCWDLKIVLSFRKRF